MTALPRLGVVVVLHRSADVIDGCLATLLASGGVALDVVAVDNACPEDSAARARAARVPPPHRLRVIATGRNGGFAAGVNAGLRVLLEDPDLDRFWILNPDTLVPPGTAAAFATHPAPGGFGLIGGRVVYADPPGRVQIDGGVIDRATGRTRNLNQGAPADAPPPGRPADFVTGASLVASREMIARAGPMPEEYFLYYEEVAWAAARGDLPILHCPAAVVRHRAGSSIGSVAPGRGPSVFSTWFLHRARLRFVRRHLRRSLAGALAFSTAKAAREVLRGRPRHAAAILGASFDRPPPREVRDRLSPDALAVVTGDGTGRRSTR